MGRDRTLAAQILTAALLWSCGRSGLPPPDLCTGVDCGEHGTCQTGACLPDCAAPASCTADCTDIVSGTSSQQFIYDAPAKLCIAEGADWTGGVVFNQNGTLEICGSAAPSWSFFNGAGRELLVRLTGTLDVSGAPSSAVDNEGLVRVAGALVVDPGHPWTNRGRIEVAGDHIVNGNAQLQLDSDSVIAVQGTFGNNGTVDGIGAVCGAIQVGGSTATNSGVIRNNADVCPLTDNTGAGPDIPPCSCSPTPPCGR